MRSEDLVGLIVVLVLLVVYIGLIVLGVMIAIRKNRSPHWMWFAIHPLGLLITLIVMASLSPLKRCPRCAEKTKSHARICAFCGHDFMAAQQYAPPYPPQPGSIYTPPQA